MILLWMSLYLMGCDLGLGTHYDDEQRTFFVDYYREACDDSSSELCLRIRSEDESTYSPVSIPTIGFESLEWGTRYKVTANVEINKNGQDESYAFISTLSSEVIDPISNDFVLTIVMSSGILQDNSTDGSESTWILGAEKTFTCEPADCSVIASASRADNKIQLNFNVTSTELVLRSVKCSATEDDFSSECEGVKESTWDIAHYKTDCGLFLPTWCHVYKESSESSSNWTLLPIDITGFTESEYEWGTQYGLNINETLKSGSLYSATLNSENERAQLIESFKWVMRFDSSSDKSNQGLFKYLDVEFDCEQYSICNKIDRIINDLNDSEQRILILDGFVEATDESEDASGEESDGNFVIEGDSVIIEELVCDAAPTNFNANCADDYDDVYWVNKG